MLTNRAGKHAVRSNLKAALLSGLMWPAFVGIAASAFASGPSAKPPSQAQDQASSRPHVRARDLGVPFDGTPGPLDAITDVKGVEVGFTTLISGEGKLVVGQGPVRTGVTAVLPRGKESTDQVFAGWFTENGNGEMTGTTWVEESGFLEGPVMITNTHSVGVVRDAVIQWRVKHGQPADSEYWWSLPVVAETYDGFLNDVNGFHVKPEDAWHALDSARAGPVPEGNVGGGTGMVCYEFKGGTGTASRTLPASLGGYTVGVLVQCNCGERDFLRIAGVPVGREIPEHKVWSERRDPANSSGGAALAQAAAESAARRDAGSIIIVVATDAPLLPTQLKRIARRATLGLARTGTISGDGSGDIFIAFSTANPGASKPSGIHHIDMVPNDQLDPVFEATVEATEEAVVNAMVGAETMSGINGNTAIALPHDRLQEVLKKYNRLGH